MEALATGEEIRAAFTKLGFGCGERTYFGSGGLLVTEPTVDVEIPVIGRISIVERSVFITPMSDAWELRITPHGGPHWLCRARTIEDIAKLGLQALRAANRSTPPSDSWKEEEHL